MQIRFVYRRIVLLLIYMVFISINTNAQKKINKLQASSAVLPLDPAVRTGKLANGFTYYIRHNEEPKNRVVFYLANKVGSVLETDDQRGLAHFMEHMSFKGTKHFPKHELVNYLQKTGIRFGADLNAYTGFDETVYQLPLPAEPEVIKNGIQIMRDWAQDATLDAGEINSERGVVLEEKRLRKGAEERVQEKYRPLLMNNSRYAKRLPIGTEEVLNNFDPETIRSFYHDWYRPDLQALIVVGDIDVNQIEQAVKMKFSDLKNPLKEKVRTRYNIPLTGKNQFIVITDPEITTTTAEVTMKQEELPLHTAAQFRQSIVRRLFNSMMRLRCNELQSQGTALFLQGGTGYQNFMGGLDNFTVSVVAKPGELEKGFKAVWYEAERVRKYGFTSTELGRVKLNYLNYYKTAVKENDKNHSLNYVNEYLQYYLKGIAAVSIDQEYQMVKEDLTDITLADVNKLANGLTQNKDRDIIITAPEKEKVNLPSEALFNSWIREVQTGDIKTYHDEVITAGLLPAPPVPGKIVSKYRDAGLGLTTIILSNGIKVLLKPTTYQNDQVIFNGFASGGTSLYSDPEFQSALAAGMIASFGAGNFNTTQLNKYLSGKQLNVSPFIEEWYQGINGDANNNDMESALQLVYAYFTTPRKDLVQFSNNIERSKAALLNRSADPESMFQDTARALLSGNNIRRTGPSLEKINQINLNRAYEIYKERFADASGFTFVFVGNIDTVKLKPLVEKYLGSLPTLHLNQQAKDLNINIPAGIIQKTVYKGAEPKANVNLIFSGSFDYSFKNVIIMDALKECLQLRLIERLRIEESGVYSPRAEVSEAKIPQPRFSLRVSFGCAPQNVDKLIASVLDEVAKIRKDGPTQENLDKFKAENKRVTETQIKTNGFWLGYLTGQLQDNEPLDQLNDYDKNLKSITIGDVKKMAEKNLDGSNFIRLILMPEK